MKNLESLKGNKLNMDNVKGGQLDYETLRKREGVHMTASYTRPTSGSSGSSITNDWFDASTNGDPGYSNVIDN